MACEILFLAKRSIPEDFENPRKETFRILQCLHYPRKSFQVAQNSTQVQNDSFPLASVQKYRVNNQRSPSEEPPIKHIAGVCPSDEGQYNKRQRKLIRRSVSLENRPVSLRSCCRRLYTILFLPVTRAFLARAIFRNLPSSRRRRGRY